MADPKSATLLKLLDALRENLAKHHELVELIALEIDGGISARVGRCIVMFRERWQALYQTPLSLNQSQRAAMVSHFRRFLVDVGEVAVMERLAFYFESIDGYYKQRRHPFELFVRDFNSLIGLPLASAVSSDDSAQRARELRGQ